MDASTYTDRRNHLRTNASEAVLLIPGHQFQPRNYRANVYPFRQSSHMLYFTGLSRDSLVLVIGATPQEDILYGRAASIDDVVWHGPEPSLEEQAATAGIEQVRPLSALSDDLREAGEGGRLIHYLHPTQASAAEWLGDILGVRASEIASGWSRSLATAIAEQRNCKTSEEIAEIEEALGVTSEMHLECMRMTQPGITEAQIAGAIQGIALSFDREQAYNPIISVRGEVLHNNTYKNVLQEGQILLNDSGAESPLFYASDITRCCPVSGTFTDEQRGIYDVVLQGQLAGIETIAPDVPYADVHMASARAMAVGLTEMGLMNGPIDDAVAAGAHALFFPHGIGHLLGLDVHDMEDLGDIAGYGEGRERSEVFGLNFLRLGRPLEEGFVVTVEPGIYFIEALIEKWEAQGTHAEFLNFERIKDFVGMGGIRIEDDVLCTADGFRVLGPDIPKTAADVQEAMAS